MINKVECYKKYREQGSTIEKVVVAVFGSQNCNVVQWSYASGGSLFHQTSERVFKLTHQKVAATTKVLQEVSR